MADYKSKRTGEQIEALLDKAAEVGPMVTESTVSGWGFTKNQGTVTGVKVNGSTKTPSSGTVDIGSVVTSVKINGSTKSPSNGVVDLGTVITSHQDISGKQDKLVSGTNIKTINGASILGSGDLDIGGGDSGIITFEKIYPQHIGDAVTYRVPAGATCELILRQNFTPTANTYIEIIFEGVPMVTEDDANAGDYVGSPSASKYHIRCYHKGFPVSFQIEGVEGSNFYTNGGEEFDPTLGWCFELDALCQNLKWFNPDYGEHMISGEIYGAFAIYN
jgi:hypothetical protein